MIVAERVSISFGRKRIVSGVDFEAHPGEVSAIVGPNGSGKTTFLKALSGDAGYGGRISINGRELRSMKAWESAAMRRLRCSPCALPRRMTLMPRWRR